MRFGGGVRGVLGLIKFSASVPARVATIAGQWKAGETMGAVASSVRFAGAAADASMGFAGTDLGSVSIFMLGGCTPVSGALALGNELVMRTGGYENAANVAINVVSNVADVAITTGTTQ